MIQSSVIANSSLLYALIAVGLLMVVVFAAISAVKASRRCIELGRQARNDVRFSMCPRELLYT